MNVKGLVELQRVRREKRTASIADGAGVGKRSRAEQGARAGMEGAVGWGQNLGGSGAGPAGATGQE